MIGRGLDFLGYSLLPHIIVGPSLPALKHCAARIIQLYEQGADFTRIGQYVRHWCRWYVGRSGLVRRVTLISIMRSLGPMISGLLVAYV